jgi:hypothetical protein
MDQFDRATELEEKQRELSIEANRQGRRLIPVGRCFNCDSPVPASHVFCDADCRDDYEKREKTKCLK